MKAKNFVDKSIIIAYVLVTILFFIPKANGGSGGGSGVPITPYASGSTPNIHDVNEIKNNSKETRRIEYLKIKDERAIRNAEQVGLMYLKMDKIDGVTFFEFRGTSDTGKEVTIDFSEVERFSIIRFKDSIVGKDQALLNIIWFPNISVNDLIDKNPSYSTLKKDHTEQILLWIKLEDDKKRKLYLVGKRWSDNYEILAKLRDIEENSEIVLEYGIYKDKPTVWWAIDSVIKDKAYPLRLWMAK